MKEAPFLEFSLGFAVFLALLHIAMSRGKFEAKGFFLVVGYGLAVGLPIAYAVMLPGRLDLAVYLLVVLPLILPFLVNEAISMAKGRGPRFRSVCGMLGLVSMILVPLFPLRLILLPVCFGLAGIGILLAFHFRYPGLNPMWLSALVSEAVKGLPLGCGYSPKPITILMASRITFLSGLFGCSIYVRKDRTTLWMKRKFHEKLGKPNLEMLARRIAEMVQKDRGGKDATHDPRK
jgi:hypothetical protein